ncbi:C2 calcium-dependent membrane targeting [Gossypium australe]|uniref:C2 calcium-dependent membrane targeting n=1 Tax=Gossypium australe TaxID=47621 RepID=A0A5B6W1Y4_9ROSI|nr:C2 calcium-dependent membrane targeting [Gossypium australe]
MLGRCTAQPGPALPTNTIKKEGLDGEKLCAGKTLISAQGLKERSGTNTSHQMKTYALAWNHSSFKLRTSIDRDGNENPTWNDQFLFKVSSDFLSHETSGVSIEIFAVGSLRDTLLGPIQGVLNFDMAVFDGADVPAFNGVSAINNDSTTSSLLPASTASREWDGIIQGVKKSNHMKSSASCRKLYCEMETPSKADRLSPFIFNRAESFNEGKLRWGSGFLPPSILPMRKYIALFTNNKKYLRKLTATALLCFACLSPTNLRILRQPFGFPVLRIFLDLTACLMLNIDYSFLSISSFA